MAHYKLHNLYSWHYDGTDDDWLAVISSQECALLLPLYPFLPSPLSSCIVSLPTISFYQLTTLSCLFLSARMQGNSDAEATELAVRMLSVLRQLYR